MFRYVLSDLIDYSLLICDDAGPVYASNMDWNSLRLRDLDRVNDEILIIDPRMQEQELDRFERLIKSYPKTFFLFRVADPYTEIYRDHFYYLFLEKIAMYQNVYLLSTYQPKELVLKLKEYYSNRFLHLPYPYLSEKEINRTSARKHKIIISGSIQGEIYPYRTKIWKKLTRSIVRFIFFSILKHPGYLDVQPNSKHKHSLIRNEFINHLSTYKFMLLCPSRCGLEFLKFAECAYAGCIPVGLPPDSYPSEIKKLFLKLRPDRLNKDSFDIIFGKHEKNIIQKIRVFLKETRSPAMLNITLKKFIDENTIHHS